MATITITSPQKATAGNAILITAKTKDNSGDLFTPSNGVTINIYATCGTLKVSAVSMTEGLTGVWTYEFQSAATDKLGNYDVEIVALDDSGSTTYRKRISAFELVQSEES